MGGANASLAPPPEQMEDATNAASEGTEIDPQQSGESGEMQGEQPQTRESGEEETKMEEGDATVATNGGEESIGTVGEDTIREAEGDKESEREGSGESNSERDETTSEQEHVPLAASEEAAQQLAVGGEDDIAKKMETD